ncbi:hypothetical protein [Dapis sp. BLCC M172]
MLKSDRPTNNPSVTNQTTRTHQQPYTTKVVTTNRRSLVVGAIAIPNSF